MSFCTYIHRRNDTGDVFYVGKGSQRRARSLNGRTQHWRNVATKHGHTVEVLAHWPTEADALAHERFLIACMRDIGAPLVNLTDGGEGASGYRPSAEAIAKSATARRGAKRSVEARARMSAALRGRKLSCEARAKVSAFQRGRKQSAEHAAKRAAAKCRRVVCACTGEEFSSVANAARAVGRSQSAISNAASGRSKTAAGFVWRYTDA